MKNILFLFPTAWDRRQLTVCRAAWCDRYAVQEGSPSDEDCSDQFDVLAYVADLARTHRGDLAGVTSSSDYPGAVAAAALATALGLSGSRPETVLACSHKLQSRRLQRHAVPDAVPAFAAVDAARPFEPLCWRDGAPQADFPCFVKPVKGAFSVLSGVVRDAAELAAFVQRPAVAEYLEDYLRIFHRLVERLAPWMPDSRLFLAEEVLSGLQVTVEGFALEGDVEILGIVDSVMHPSTRSFARFEYPSALPEPVQQRMIDIVRRCVLGLGLDRTLFNVELMYDERTGRISIIEINPRMCGQFADLYEKVDGTNGYEVALALAAGERPVLQRRRGAYPVAASVPLRVFEPVRIVRAPSADMILAAETLYPGTLIWVECETGQSLCDFESLEDGCSARYAVLNLGAEDRAALPLRAEAVRARLGFEFEPLAATSPVVATETRARG